MEEHFFQHLQPTTSEFRFIEQDFGYFCKGDTVFLTKSSKLNYKLLPDWIGVQIRIDRAAFSATEEEKTLQAVVLSGARVDIVSLHTQISETKVADPNMKFLKLEYKSVEEVRRRMAILYLQTLEHRNRSFIPFFTIAQLNHPFLMSKLRNI